jgi:hypothetical protein
MISGFRPFAQGKIADLGDQFANTLAVGECTIVIGKPQKEDGV